MSSNYWGRNPDEDQREERSHVLERDASGRTLIPTAADLARQLQQVQRIIHDRRQHDQAMADTFNLRRR